MILNLSARSEKHLLVSSPLTNGIKNVDRTPVCLRSLTCRWLPSPRSPQDVPRDRVSRHASYKKSPISDDRELRKNPPRKGSAVRSQPYYGVRVSEVDKGMKTDGHRILAECPGDRGRHRARAIFEKAAANNIELSSWFLSGGNNLVVVPFFHFPARQI